MIPLSPHDPPRVGPYTLRARLGEDAATRTYLAASADGAPAALKVMRSALSTDPAFREAFANLAQSALVVRSPYVAGVLDSSQEGPAQWVAVARPIGPTLAECVRAHGPLPTAALPPLALAMAQGLGDLHAASHIHGSLGPDEILLTEHGTVLADAGFEQAAVVLGRRPDRTSHSAPEGGLSPTADVFAWASTLCFAASGINGTGGVGHVPMQMRGLVDACLEQDPDLRPTSADLVRILGGPAVPGAWPANLVGVIHHHGRALRELLARKGPRNETRHRRRTVGLAASGMALVLVAGGGAVWALGNGSGGVEGSEQATPGMISDSTCADADSLPEPGGAIDNLDATGVSFSPDGTALLASSQSHGLTVWDWEEGVEIARPADGAYPDHPGAFAPVGCMVAAMDPMEFQDTGYEYPVLNTHDLPSSQAAEHLGPQSERVLDELEAPRQAVAFDFAPSGQHLAVAVGFEGGVLDSEDRQPTVGIIDMDDGELVHEWGNDINVWDLAHVDDERLVVSTIDVLQVHDVETGELLSTIRDYSGHGFGVVPGAGEIVYPSNEDLVRWDLDEGTEMGRYPIPQFAEIADEGVITGIEADQELGLLHFSWFGPQRGESATGEDVAGTDRPSQNNGLLWDMETGKELAQDDELTGPVAFHPEGEVIASRAPEGDVLLLDPDSLAPTATLP